MLLRAKVCGGKGDICPGQATPVAWNAKLALWMCRCDHVGVGSLVLTRALLGFVCVFRVYP
jgi:hypothetical protein